MGLFKGRREMRVLMGICAASLVMMAGTAAFAKNPGESAAECVTVSRGGDDNSAVTFTNRCNEKIFVLWCGQLKYSSKQCGEGPKDAGKGLSSAGFYTHSTNIEPGKSSTAHVKGQYHHAACKGGISFGNDGHYTDDAAGGYRCLKK